jgi:transposase
LAAAEGEPADRIAARLDINRKTVMLWRQRLQTEGLKGLWEVAPGRGRKAIYDADKIRSVVDATLRSKPKGMTHWSTRLMAEAQNISKSTVSNIWRSHNLKPHRTKTFKLSRDARFLEKLTDVVGLYLNPPEQAIVLCVDEKSQIQALDRTAPVLPLRPGIPARQTHDYTRHGTTTLFAALSLLDGKVIGECLPRHRSREFIRFLRTVDRETPAELDLHLIVDNSSTHKSPPVQRWLTRHPRVHLHFIPTSSSWCNMVQRWFGEITQKRIRRGTFHSVQELVAAITEYLRQYNQAPTRFVWTKDADMILGKIRRCKEA